MKREGLRRRLALCILETLVQHKITLPNVKRYVTPEVLAQYTIRKTTKITDQDIDVALRMLQSRKTIKPPLFRFAPKGSLWAQKREEHFLRAPLTDLL